MKFATVILLLVSGGALLAQEVLTNDSVLKMVKNGLDESLIIQKIQTDPGHFALTTDDLIKLKNDGVSQPIIKAMMAKGSSAPAESQPISAAHQPSTSTGEPPCPSENGPYYLNGATWKPMQMITLSGAGTKINPVPFFGSAKMNNRYPGTAAPITVGPMPVFCHSGQTQFSRNIVIASLQVKGDHRELQIGSAHGFGGAKVGVADKNLQPIEITTSDSGLRLTTKAPLAPGQYIILPSSSGGMGFDFGVSDSAQ